MQAVKEEPDLVTVGSQEKNNWAIKQVQHQKYTTQLRRQESEGNRSPNTNTAQTGSSVLEQVQSPADDTVVSPTSTLSSAPLCRQFWKAGSYTNAHGSKVNHGKTYLHVHPMFLHSNATSHKWAFGAIAELLDNAIDEIQNGASFVIVDKISSPRDGVPALLIQDDGGGMNLEAMRRCMSFGFSDKKSAGSIGQYGNGFKTSTMRLGADVIVFTRHREDRCRTASIGLLSYTFLMQMGHERIIVPMVDYEFDTQNKKFEVSRQQTKESFKANLSLFLQWSPYSTEAELLKNFDDIGLHGTKVVIYNLWHNDDGNTELDFDTDPQDIRIEGDIRKIESLPAWRTLNEQHISNRLHYSLHAYMSILYLRIPESFSVILRGQVVRPYNLADELKFQQYILYKPQTGGLKEGHVITTIGFVKDAPRVCMHGFNIYHKNRLIQPFMQVVRYADSRGRGVVGILEANFIQPTHNKQDFERTSLFQKLEVRLKEMTFEYWDYHCGLIGYQVRKKVSAVNSQHMPPVIEHTRHSNAGMPNRTFSRLGTKRKEHNYPDQTGSVRKLSRTGSTVLSASGPEP
ncbi:Protein MICRORCHIDIA 6 [Linum perenne]